MRHAVPHAAMQAYQPESAIHSAVFFFHNKSASAAAAETISRTERKPI
jgi:hypothetical protein